MFLLLTAQPVFTCLKSTVEAPDQIVKSVNFGQENVC